MFQALCYVAEQFGWNFIFLYAFGQGFDFTGITIYFILEFASCAAFIPLVRRLPILPAMRLGLVLRMAAFALLLHFFWQGQLYIASVLLGAFVTFFWIPYNTRYVQLTRDGSRAQSSAALFMLFAVLGATLPALAGLVIVLYGFDSVLLVCIAVIAAGLLASYRLDPAGEMAIELGPMLRRTRRLWYVLLAEGFWQGVFWLGVPLGLILNVNGADEYGAFYSLFGLLGGAASIIAGRWSDRQGSRRPPIYASAVAGGLLSIAAGLALDNVALWAPALSAVYFCIYVLWPFTFCAVSELSTTPAEAMTVREFLTNIGRVAGGLLVLAVLLLFPSDSRSAALSAAYVAGGAALLALAAGYRALKY